MNAVTSGEAVLNVDAQEPIRLVVWDLDDTLWKGTLTEGGITAHVPSHYAAVVELARRGILSSICSKNDRHTVEAILKEQGVWDYFVFPSINWSAKGERVASIIEAMQLRPQSVLFIDDHPANRAEAMALVPGLRAVDELFIADMLENPLLIGKADPDLTRLQQYKNLETKAADRERASDDLSFLRKSDIHVEIEHDCTPHLGRIVELLNRTNQLNFTKRRLPEERSRAEAELVEQLHATSGRRAGIVKVRDRFGDYGVVGFWMMDGIWVEPYMIHFVFSCRTLGMGIEQWVYDKLGRPRLDVVGEVVSKLDDAPNWINASAGDLPSSARTETWGPVRLRGGCELEVVKHFISFQAPSVRSEFVFPRDGQVIWSSHSQTLFEQPAAMSAEGRLAIQNLGLRPEDLSSDSLRDMPEGGCLILSNSADGQVTLFKHNHLDLIVPLKLFGLDLTKIDEAHADAYIKANKLSDAQETAFRTMLCEVSSSFTPLRFDEFDYRALYDRICDAIPASCLLIFLQPVTFAPASEGGVIRLNEQVQINDWVTQAARKRENVRIVRCEDCVTSVGDLRNNSHLHFKRDVYFRIYEALEKTFTDWKKVLAVRAAASELA